MRSVKTSGGMTRGRGMAEAQRSQWLLSMPARANFNNAMQELTTVGFYTSEQHKEATKSRKEKDHKDTLTILSFLNDRNPFGEDQSLRNIETGVTATSGVNVDKAKEIGLGIIESMAGQNVVEYSFKRSKQATTLSTKTSVKIDGHSVEVDPQLLFQRLTTVGNLLHEDHREMFRYELSTFPSALFGSSGLLREACKPALADAIWRLVGDSGLHELPSENIQHVLDGGSLLQRIPWSKGASFASICQVYIDYITRRYSDVVVVFDGYNEGPSTKDITHIRRTRGITSPKVNFTEDVPCKSKKETFLSNTENKQKFINLLSSKLHAVGYRTVHASGDADLCIVKTAVSLSETSDVVVVGEDTDLLILLCFHADLQSMNIYFTSETKQINRKKVKLWNIKPTKVALGEHTCHLLPFIHALTGCDTTSRLFGIGKPTALQKLRTSEHVRKQGDVFMNVSSCKADVIKAGEEALVALYGGNLNEGLNDLRFRRFNTKVMTATTHVQVHTLPPTSDAASFHSLRVYLQCQNWIAENVELDPNVWGWQTVDATLYPIQTKVPPAPDRLLKVIRCNCKVNCDSKRCTCRKHGLECSIGCGECRGVNCTNSQNFIDSEHENMCLEGKSVVIEQRWALGGTTDCSFDTTPQDSVLVNSSIQCLALMQPHSGESRVASFNKATGECSIVVQAPGSAPSTSYVTQGSAIRKEENNSCHEVWEKVFEVDSDGSVLFGDVAQLVTAIKNSSYIRIHQKPNFYMEADDLIWKGSVVCGASAFVLSKASWGVFEANMHWQFTRICSTGKTYVSQPYVGTDSILPDVEYSMASTWFVRKHRASFPNPVYCNVKTSTSTCGDLVDLITAVKQGSEIRLSRTVGAQEMYSYTPSRLETTLGASNCEVVGQMFWKVGGYGGPALNFRFFQPLYWWIRLYSTGGAYVANRWYVGKPVVRKQTSSTATIDWFVDHCWVFSYTHTAAGEHAFGSLQTLIDLLLLGRRVRVVFDSFAMEGDAILIEGGVVTAQLLSQIDTVTPITFQANAAHLKLIRLSTNGTFLVDLYAFGSSNRVGQDTLVSAASWVLETREWILALKTDETGIAVTGSKHDLEQAIRAGSRLRCLVNIDISTRLIMTMDNIDIDNDGNVAAQFFRLMEFGDSADLAFHPYWRIIILTTSGEMMETHWTLGEHENRGNTAASVAIDWFVD